MNGPGVSAEINDPGSIPDPPGRSTFNEGGGGGVRNVVFPQKNHFPQIFAIFA
jgi:hypothetical protein